MNNLSATLSASMEAIFITVTYGIIRKVLAGVAGKLAGSLGASAVAAAADGPLPVGDIVAAFIAGGGLVWSAWDIRQAAKQQRKLPAKIQQCASETLDSMQKSADKIIADSCASKSVPPVKLAFR